MKKLLEINLDKLNNLDTLTKDFADETLTVFGIIWDDYESYEEFFKRFETFF